MPIQTLTQKGNAKLAEAGTLMFNIPAGKKWCSMECPGCYAMKEQKRYPSTLIARTGRYEASLQEDFVDRIVYELKYAKKKPKYYRIHASGEFYSQEYVDKWQKIAEQFPEITFYAYTKRKKHFDFSKILAMDNFILIDSLHWGKLNYGPLEKAPEGAFICPEQPGSDTVCGVTCTFCMTKDAQESAPYFKKH